MTQTPILHALDTLDSMAILCIDPKNQEILYYNRVVQSLLPTIQIGTRYPDVLDDTILLPLRDMVDTGCRHTLCFGSVFGCTAACTLSPCMWNDQTPALMITAILDQIPPQNPAPTFSERDHLTGLLTVGELERRMAKDLQANASGTCTLRLFDIKNMRGFNQQYGAQKGDAFLCGVANLLKNLQPPNALCARTGGNEFCIYCPTADPDASAKRMEQFFLQYEQLYLVDIGAAAQPICTESVTMERKNASFSALYQQACRSLAHRKKGQSMPAQCQKHFVLHMNKCLLLVDNSPSQLQILHNVFCPDCTIYQASTERDAIALIERHAHELSAILISDCMPEFSNYNLLAFMRKMNDLPQIPVLFLTNNPANCHLKNAYAFGVTDMVLYPVDHYILRRRVFNTIELYHYQNHLEELVTNQTRTLQLYNNHMAYTLGAIIEFRNRESGQHVRRVRDYTRILANALAQRYPEYQLTPQQISIITRASPLHDVGKIAVPDAVLLKPGKLTASEFEMMKTHTTQGAYLLERTLAIGCDPDFSQCCIQIARWHHEKWDGNGYPDGLCGDEIPIAAQIVSLADMYDALTSERCYKKPCSSKKAYKMILCGDCGQMNQKLLHCFVAVREQIEAAYPAPNDMIPWLETEEEQA